MNDHELLHQFINTGDQHAFAQLANRYANLVHGIARRQAPADADDVTQAVFWLLARRAREVQKHPTLAGWLFRVTWNCCANARRSEKRRQTHERESWQMINTKPSAEHREEIIHQLDRALATIPSRYRDAVLLRYLQGRSVEETAALLGLSPAAAGKRATRGLEKLRARYLRTGHATALGALATMLASESAKAAPPVLIQALATGTMGSAASTKTLLLAKIPAKTLALPFVKIAASVTLALTLLTALVVPLRKPPAMATPGVATPPAVRLAAGASPSQVDSDEPALPGNLCIAVSDLLIDPAGAAALRHATQPVDAKSTIFELRQSSAAAARRVLNELRLDGQIVEIDHTVDLDHSVVHQQIFSNQPLNAMPFSSRSYWGPSAQRPFEGEVIILLPKNYLTAEVAGPAVKLALNFDHADARFQLDRAIPQPQHKEISVHYTGTFAPGQMLLLLGDSGPWDGDPLTNVRLIEVYKATQTQFDFLDVLKFPWVFAGPAEARKTIDRALLWAAKGDLRPADMPPSNKKWSRQLPDGTTVELTSIARPDEFPLCRWDADGKPQLFVPVSFASNEHFSMIVSVRVRSPFPLEAPLPNRTWDGFVTVEVPDTDQHFDVYVGTGPWKEHPIAVEDYVPFGDHFVSISNVLRNEHSINAEFHSDLGPDTEVQLAAITVDHQRIIAESYVYPPPHIWVQTSQTAAEIKYGVGFNIAPERLDHFLLLTRPRQKMTFTDFAHKPTNDPPPEVHPEDARGLDQKIIDAQQHQRQEWWTRAWEQRTADLAALDAIPRDPATPAGSMRLLVDQALAGNAAATRALLTGPDELATALSEFLANYGRAFTQCQRKFTPEGLAKGRWETTTSGTISGKPYLPLLPAEDLLSFHWTITDTHATNGTHQTLLLQNGRWYLDLTRYSEIDENSRLVTLTHIQKQAQLAQSLVRDLAANKITTPTEAARRLREIATAARLPEASLLPQ